MLESGAPTSWTGAPGHGNLVSRVSEEVMDMWATAFEGFKQGLKEGPRVFFAPITPRVWRYAISVSRKRGVARGVGALLCHGPMLLAEGKLLRSGQPQNGS